MTPATAPSLLGTAATLTCCCASTSSPAATSTPYEIEMTFSATLVNPEDSNDTLEVSGDLRVTRPWCRQRQFPEATDMGATE